MNAEMLMDKEYAMNHWNDDDFVPIRYITRVHVEYYSPKMGFWKFEFYSHLRELRDYDTAEKWVRKNIVPIDTNMLIVDIQTSYY